MINIIKGSIRNIVDEVQFEKLYKPNGWQIDQPSDTKEIEKKSQTPLDVLKTETEVKNYMKMARNQPKKFDDNLFYSELENNERS